MFAFVALFCLMPYVFAIATPSGRLILAVVTRRVPVIEVSVGSGLACFDVLKKIQSSNISKLREISRNRELSNFKRISRLSRLIKI